MEDGVVFIHGFKQVLFDPATDMVNLTSMYRAFGAPKGKDPRQWARSVQARDLIEILAEVERARRQRERDSMPAESTTPTPLSTPRNFVELRRGTASGTYADQRLAIAYAHYLHPHFYLWWNAQIDAYLAQGHSGDTRPGMAFLAALVAEVTALHAQMEESDQPEAVQRRKATRVATEPHPQSLAIIAVLAAVGGGPLSTGEIRATLLQTGEVVIDDNQVRTRLYRMATRGELRRCGRGSYALLEED